MRMQFLNDSAPSYHFLDEVSAGDNHEAYFSSGTSSMLPNIILRISKVTAPSNPHS